MYTTTIIDQFIIFETLSASIIKAGQVDSEDVAKILNHFLTIKK